jgi:hypothetical protein
VLSEGNVIVWPESDDVYILIADHSGSQSKVWVYGWSLVGIVGLYPTGGMVVCLL